MNFSSNEVRYFKKVMLDHFDHMHELWEPWKRCSSTSIPYNTQRHLNHKRKTIQSLSFSYLWSSFLTLKISLLLEKQQCKTQEVYYYKTRRKFKLSSILLIVIDSTHTKNEQFFFIWFAEKLINLNNIVVAIIQLICVTNRLICKKTKAAINKPKYQHKKENGSTLHIMWIYKLNRTAKQ